MSDPPPGQAPRPDRRVGLHLPRLLRPAADDPAGRHAGQRRVRLRRHAVPADAGPAGRRSGRGVRRGATSFRNELYDDYKANRDEPPPELRPQFRLVREAARAFGLPVVDVEGFEADDLIAAYARPARAAGEPVTIVSSDKDLMQLVGDGVAMWDPMKQKSDRARRGGRAVRRRAGAGPRRPGADRRHLGQRPGRAGDRPQDRGPAAAELGSLEGLLANLDKIRQPKRREVLERNAEQARLSYRLVCLDPDAPVPLGLDELRRKPSDPQALLEFLQRQRLQVLGRGGSPGRPPRPRPPAPSARRPAGSATARSPR